MVPLLIKPVLSLSDSTHSPVGVRAATPHRELTISTVSTSLVTRVSITHTHKPPYEDLPTQPGIYTGFTPVSRTLRVVLTCTRTVGHRGVGNLHTQVG